MAGAGHRGLRLLPLWTLALPPCPGALGVEPALVTALSSWPSHLCLFRPMPVPSELWGFFANSTAPCYLESGLRGRSGGGSPFRGLVAHLLWDCPETIYRPLFPGPAPTRAVSGITVVDIAGVAGPGADLAARGQAGPMGPLCRRPAGWPLLPFSQGPPDSALKAGQVGQRCQADPRPGGLGTPRVHGVSPGQSAQASFVTGLSVGASGVSPGWRWAPRVLGHRLTSPAPRLTAEIGEGEPGLTTGSRGS